MQRSAGRYACTLRQWPEVDKHAHPQLGVLVGFRREAAPHLGEVQVEGDERERRRLGALPLHLLLLELLLQRCDLRAPLLQLPRLHARASVNPDLMQPLSALAVGPHSCLHRNDNWASLSDGRTLAQ